MTQIIQSILEIADTYDAIVLDQWGVLHDGSSPYPHALDAVERLSKNNTRLAVLSNSGRRAEPNLQRIAKKGFNPAYFERVMTSGEAIWNDIDAGHIEQKTFYSIASQSGDAMEWAQGLQIRFVDQLDQAEAILLMGLPDSAKIEDYHHILEAAKTNDQVMYCSNPDRKSPRAGELVISPGELAHQYQEMGGETHFYGKPLTPIFTRLQEQLNANKILMVGDSLEHDIAGASHAGWDSLFVQSGIHARDFANGDVETTINKLSMAEGSPKPTYTIVTLK